MRYSEIFDMDSYNYGHDRLRELWQQIGSLHLSYLEMEESPNKLKQRNVLEGIIHEYLCLAPHNQKFMFRETADVLHRSASTKKDFSGYKATLGWNAIAMYAANLVTQPWRNEYKQIKLYSGFYKHQIDSNLVGAEVLFEVMGYKHDGDGILAFEGPICPDRVISISQDCLIAYVECQILKAIWEEVSHNFKPTWLDILEFRETHLCSLKQSIQALNYRLHERQFHQHTRSYSQVPPPPPPYACQTIPTGQLIEVDTPTPHHYDTVDSPNSSPHRANESYKIKNDKCIGEKEESNSDTMASWDYVYRNLESQGYSKDLGERGDLLSPSLEARKEKVSPTKDARKGRLSGLENSVSTINLSDKQKVTDIQPKYSKERIRHNSDVSKSNDMENKHCDAEVLHKKHIVKQAQNGVVKSNTLSVRDKPTINSVLSSKTLDLRKQKTPRSNEKLKSKENMMDDDEPWKRWQCSTCTFLNHSSSEICEMCFKSKTKVQDIMAIGGSQCPKCTLVNPKDNKICDACRESLENSPTYI
ncbi:protein tamozhennic isoform X2 [Photinus pyralis]|uniref:RanBP2-type domain-containing protein n=1 Tax=Photinus pyralis TaxID=7054 RepID=A0A1Y1N0X3_PHOPY|nr:protein tamozhennic isoform X2 [Photinus pyralis]